MKRSEKIGVPLRDFLFALGYRDCVPNEAKALIQKAQSEVYEAAKCRYVIKKYPLEISENVICMGGIKTESRDLAKHLSGCKSAYVFAATLGSDVDRVIMKYSGVSPALSVMCDTYASLQIECFCDKIEREAVKDKSAVSRFSPGYGDLSLDMQKDILKDLSAQSEIGLYLTDSDLMVPTKSVTAIIGIGGKQ